MYTRINDVPVKEDYSFQRDGKIPQLNLKDIPFFGSDKVPLSIMLGGFFLLSIILSLVFFLLGSSGKKLIFGLAGFGLGVLISLLIWFLWGKNNYKLF
jgi:hypothetical protein